MAVERSIVRYCIKCQENSYNGRHKIHWYIFVQTPCQGGPSGLIKHITKSCFIPILVIIHHLSLFCLRLSPSRFSSTCIYFRLLYSPEGKHPLLRSCRVNQMQILTILHPRYVLFYTTPDHTQWEFCVYIYSIGLGVG